MPIREITIDKIPDARAALSLIQGEGRAQIVRFVINRNEGGVDLSGLQWMVRAVNAVGDSDVYILDAPTFDDKMLTVDWLVHGVATAVAGETRERRKKLEEIRRKSGSLSVENHIRATA